MKKILVVAALVCAAVLVPAVPAAAAVPATSAPRTGTDEPPSPQAWYPYGRYWSHAECNTVGSAGKVRGSWPSYHCDYRPTSSPEIPPWVLNVWAT